MKKFLKATLAIALLATLLVASIVSVNAAEENLAKSATYTLTRLTAGPGSDDEGAPQFLGEGRGDDLNCDRLNDGWAELSEKGSKSVCLAGTGRTHRIVFDLGAEKEVSSVVIKAINDTYRRIYEGKAAGNRGFELSQIKVYAGVELTDLNAKASETQYVDEEGKEVDWFDVTLTFNKVKTQIITIDLPSSQPGHHPDYDVDNGAYIVTLNEVEIYGGAAPAQDTTKAADDNTTAAEGDDNTTAADATNTTAAPTAAPTKPASDTPKAGDYTAVIALIAVVSLAGAAVVLKKKSF